MGVDEMGVDKMGVEEMGVDEMGTHQLTHGHVIFTLYSYTGTLKNQYCVWKSKRPDETLFV